MIRRAGLALLAALAGGALLPAAAAALPAGFEEVTLADGLNQPTAVAFAPAADGRMFIAEQPGRVKVRMPDGDVSLLLDWTDRVNSYGDRGLVGIAADTDFADNGYVYILFVADDDAEDDAGPHSSRLVRLTVSAANEVTATKSLVGGDADQGACGEPDGDHGTAADAALDCIPAWGTTHSIGTVMSDPRDGTLWFGSGDGQNVDFTTGNRPKRLLTYNEEAFVGKIVHVDREGRGVPGHPFCPAETDLDRVCTKVYAKGFRNPFRFTLPTQPGAGPIAGDVGNVSREELNVVRAGGNYGWPCWEGADVRPGYYRDYPNCTGYVNRATSPVTPANTDVPDFQYGHPVVDGTPQGAIQAGPVYDGEGYPAAYRGALFFGDYALGFVRYFPAGTSPGSFAITPPSLLPVGDGSPFDEENSSVLFDQRAAFTQLTSAPNGDLVVVDFLTPGPAYDFTGPGRVVRYAAVDSNRAPVASATVAQEQVEPGEEAAFDGTGSSDPDSDTITYAWDFDGDGVTDSTDPAPTHTFATRGVYRVTLTVDDGRGRTATAMVTVLVGEHRPEVQIDAPTAGDYVGGQTVAFSGGATDADEGGALPAASLRWEIRLIHGSHQHPLVDVAGQASGAFTAWQDHGLDSHYRIRLVATDATGLQSSATVEIHPRPVDVELASSPAGATLELAGAAVATPGTTTLAAGERTTVRAPETMTAGGVEHRFARWSDGQTATERDYTAPAAAGTLTAEYAPVPVVIPPAPAPEPVPAPAPVAPVLVPQVVPAAPLPPTPVPAAPAPAPSSSASASTAATPRVKVSAPWTKKRRRARSVTGTVTRLTSRPKVQVAVARAAGSRCRWWSSRRKRFGRTTSCRRPVWTTAKVRRSKGAWRFTASLRATLSRRRGRVVARVVVGRKTVKQVTIRVSAAR